MDWAIIKIFIDDGVRYYVELQFWATCFERDPQQGSVYPKALPSEASHTISVTTLHKEVPLAWIKKCLKLNTGET